jgi:hypothetical protein
VIIPPLHLENCGAMFADFFFSKTFYFALVWILSIRARCNVFFNDSNDEENKNQCKH